MDEVSERREIRLRGHSLGWISHILHVPHTVVLNCDQNRKTSDLIIKIFGSTQDNNKFNNCQQLGRGGDGIQMAWIMKEKALDQCLLLESSSKILHANIRALEFVRQGAH